MTWGPYFSSLDLENRGDRLTTWLSITTLPVRQVHRSTLSRQQEARPIPVPPREEDRSGPSQEPKSCPPPTTATRR